MDSEMWIRELDRFAEIGSFILEDPPMSRRPSGTAGLSAS